MPENDKIFNQLSEFHLDAFQEVGNIGAGSAAVALTQFLNRATYMSVPNVKFDKLDNIVDLVKVPAEEKVAIIHAKTVTDILYHLFVFFDNSSINKIINLMTTQLASYNLRELSPLYKSLIKEIGSILLLKYVEALNFFLKANSFPSPPELMIDSVKSAVDTVFENERDKFKTALLIECDIYTAEIETTERSITADLAIIPHIDTFDKFLDSLFPKE